MQFRLNRRCLPAAAVCALLLATTAAASAQTAAQTPPPDPKTRLELYGFAMLDMGYQFNQNDPLWFDVVRPTKLPAFPKEFGEDGHFYSGVRQSRFGTRTFTDTDIGELRTTFEWELYGVGVDAGQTTFRLRHAYGEIGWFGAGQTWSPFMDIDVFPNSLEYWGPNGMVFFRNVQARWMPIRGDTRLTIAAERPGASGDAGLLSDRIELDNVQGRFPAPDVSAEYRYGRGWGYVEIAGIVRVIKIDDLLPNDAFDLEDDLVGWGVTLTSNLKFTDSDTLRLGVVYGEGVQNYMNDAPVDVSIEPNPGGGPRRPIRAVALPMLGATAFLDHNWNSRWSSAVGYSLLDIDNSAGQLPAAFRFGDYALANLLYTPVTNVMVGGEVQYGGRENFLDGFSSEDLRVQFGARFNWSWTSVED